MFLETGVFGILIIFYENAIVEQKVSKWSNKIRKKTG